MIIAFYILSFSGAKSSRVGAWLIIPLYSAVLIGTMTGDTLALTLLIALPTVLYLYLGTAFFIRRSKS